MTRLTAETKTIRDIFQQEYIIPNYQRPYSWDKDECQQLMDDLLLAHDEETEQYFLGCLVIAKEGNRFAIIDGQQRLTTLSLVIKALFSRDQTNLGLARMLKKVDPVSDAVSEELRLESQVWDEDKVNLERALLDTGTLQPGNRFHDNLGCIQEALDNHSAVKAGGDGLRDFIQMLQSRVVLLPIECDSRDGALTIFRTLNDRGLPLNDADIFKASMYNKLAGNKEDTDWFVSNWKALGANNDHDFVERLFRIHMHVLRADAKETDKEGKLRDYFDDKDGRLAEPRKVVAQLQKYNAILGDWGTPDINIWWQILATTPTKVLWQYPLFVFLNKYGKHEDGEFSLPEEEKAHEFVTLMKDTARYLFIKGVATRSVNTVKDTIFRVCSAIAHGENRGEDYATIYRNNANGSIENFRQRLNADDYGRYQDGLVLTNSALYLNPDKPEEAAGYSKLLMQERYQYEHILPKKWKDYRGYGWDSAMHAECIGKLGNLIPLEKHLNIRASNDFFTNKKEAYCESALVEVRDLGESTETKWTPEALEKRHGEVIARLLEFFRY